MKLSTRPLIGLVGLVAESQHASLALGELLAEPVPEDPAKDDLWVDLVVGLAHEQLEDALADGTVP